MHLLLQTQKESLLEKVKKVLQDEQMDWWDEMSDEERDEVRIGIDEGNLAAHRTVMKHFDK